MLEMEKSLNENLWGRPTLTLLKVLNVLNVLKVLDVLNVQSPRDPSPRDTLILEIIKVNPNCNMQMRF